MTTHHPVAVPSTADRSAIVRRFYFYAVALISLIVVVASIDALVAALADAWLAETALVQVDAFGYVRDIIARSAGLLLVAAPVFLIHWRAVQRRQGEAAERRSGLRSFFLHAALLITGGYTLVPVYNLLWGIAFMAFGGSPEASGIWPADWLHYLLISAIAAGFFSYFDRVARSNPDYGAETGIAGAWRRLYMTVAGLTGLALLIFGGARLLETALDAVLPAVTSGIGASVSDRWWSSQLADGTTMLLIGAVLARLNWRRWSAITAQHPGEARAGLRRFYLYAAVVISALATLVPAALVLRELLLVLFGGQEGLLQDLLGDLVTPLAFVPVGVLAWRWHWRYLSREAESYGESAQGATVRRLYYYLVAATGLILIWLGAINLLQVVLDWLLGTAAVDKDLFWTAPLATGLSLLAVGLPVWAAHWRVVQTVARSEGEAGRSERASMPRRAYLYGVALAGALLILFYLAQVLYRLLLYLLGDPNAQIVSGETVDEIARSAIAALLWAVHVLAIRTDVRLGAEEPEEPVTVDDAKRRPALEQRIAALEAELAAARAELASLPAEVTSTEEPRR